MKSNSSCKTLNEVVENSIENSISFKNILKIYVTEYNIAHQTNRFSICLLESYDRIPAP